MQGASRHRRTMAESELDFLAGFELPAASTVSSPRERQECVKNASPPTGNATKPDKHKWCSMQKSV